MHATKALQNGENPPEIYVSDGSMAERVGFEPTEGVNPQLISSFPRLWELARTFRKITENIGSLQRHYNTGKIGLQERKWRENPGGTTGSNILLKTGVFGDQFCTLERKRRENRFPNPLHDQKSGPMRFTELERGRCILYHVMKNQVLHNSPLKSELHSVIRTAALLLIGNQLRGGLSCLQIKKFRQCLFGIRMASTRRCSEKYAISVRGWHSISWKRSWCHVRSRLSERTVIG